jgi:hypothetical protein
VTLLGANFGPANQAVAATFSVTYGPNLGTTYNATCGRVPGAGNTMLLCITAPGAGGGLRWRVSVTSPGVTGDTVLSTVTTGYLPPAITSLSASATSLRTTVGARGGFVWGWGGGGGSGLLPSLPFVFGKSRR